MTQVSLDKYGTVEKIPNLKGRFIHLLQSLLPSTWVVDSTFPGVVDTERPLVIVRMAGGSSGPYTLEASFIVDIYFQDEVQLDEYSALLQTHLTHIGRLPGSGFHHVSLDGPNDLPAELPGRRFLIDTRAYYN